MAGEMKWGRGYRPQIRSGAGQPEWKFLANIGDPNPIDGSFFVYEDLTHVYDAEAEVVIPEGDDEDRWQIYRFRLEQFRIAHGSLVEYGSDRNPWFYSDLRSIASSAGIDRSRLMHLLSSAVDIDRAEAYQILISYYRAEEFDSDPLLITDPDELQDRYADEMRARN